MDLIESEITEEMVKEFCGWRYEEDYVPILSFGDVKNYIPEMCDCYKKNIEFIAYCRPDDGKFIGWCRGRHLNIEGTDIIYLGYAVNPDFQGIGMGYQILKRAFVIFQNRYGNYPFIADIEEENIRSIKLVEHLGFKYLYNIDIDDCGKTKITKRFFLEKII